VDQFDSSGINPNRLNAKGEYNCERSGSYLSALQKLRRFGDISLYDWGREPILLSHGEENANTKYDEGKLTSCGISATNSNCANVARAKYLARKRKM